VSGIPAEDEAPAIETDPSTPVGMVRLLIADTDPDNALFLDGQIEAFLTAEGDSPKRAAALALDSIAISEALISKKFSTQDLSVDGPAVAKELRAQAASYRAQAQAEEDAETAEDYGLEIQPLWSFPCASPYGDLLL
jgi:hypothetical protein